MLSCEGRIVICTRGSRLLINFISCWAKLFCFSFCRCVRNEPKIPPPPHLIVFFFGSADRFFSILFNVPFTLHGQNYTESPGWVKMSRDRGLATSKATTLFVLFCFLMGKKRIHLGFFTQRMMRVCGMFVTVFWNFNYLLCFFFASPFCRLMVHGKSTMLNSL